MAGSLMAVIDNKKSDTEKSWLLKQANMTEMRNLDCLQISKRNLF